MRARWSPWRSALAGAVIGFVEAAGSETERRTLRRPDPVVRHDQRRRLLLDPPRGLWFLEPLVRLDRWLHPN